MDLILSVFDLSWHVLLEACLHTLQRCLRWLFWRLPRCLSGASWSVCGTGWSLWSDTTDQWTLYLYLEPRTNIRESLSQSRFSNLTRNYHSKAVSSIFDQVCLEDIVDLISFITFEALEKGIILDAVSGYELCPFFPITKPFGMRLFVRQFLL